jgi:LmeA-like phospholipid-binding
MPDTNGRDQRGRVPSVGSAVARARAAWPGLIGGSSEPRATRNEPPSDDQLRPASAAQLVLSVLDGALSGVARRPLRVRAKASPGRAMRGVLSTVVLELGDVQLGDVSVERLVVRAEDLRVAPGLRPRFQARKVGLKVTVTQAALDRWTKSARIPARLRLTDRGVLAVNQVRGRTISEVTVDIGVKFAYVTLTPREAAIFGRRTPVFPGMEWYLPLPLPRGVALARVEPANGRITMYFDLPDIDETITTVVARRLLKWLRPKAKRLGQAAVRAAIQR